MKYLFGELDSYNITPKYVYFLKNKLLSKRAITIEDKSFPLEYTISPKLIKNLNSVLIEILPPENYPETPVVKQFKCFEKISIILYSNQVHVYRFNNYLSNFFGLATTEEKKVCKHLGKKLLKFALRWIYYKVKRYSRITLNLTKNDKILRYFYKIGFEITCSRDPGSIEMTSMAARFL